MEIPRCFICNRSPVILVCQDEEVVCEICKGMLETRIFVYCTKCNSYRAYPYEEQKIIEICRVNSTPFGKNHNMINEDKNLETVFNIMLTTALNSGQRIFPLKWCSHCPKIQLY